MTTSETTPTKVETSRVRRFIGILGPGLITGASDDDPSGIGTYSQAGALRRRHVMGKLVVEGWLYWLGWASTAAMALCIVGMAVSMLMPGSS